jgi:hypothetical protein
MRLPFTQALVLTLLASTPVEAHCYSVWHYPWKQRCGVARQMVRPVANRLSTVASRFSTVANRLATIRFVEPDIPLPGLARADLDGGEADEPTRARLLLRAALEAANAQ